MDGLDYRRDSHWNLAASMKHQIQHVQYNVRTIRCLL